MSNAIAERLDGIQKFADFTGREVAQLLGTTPETISRWRGGRSEPQPKLRDFYHINILIVYAFCEKFLV